MIIVWLAAVGATIIVAIVAGLSYLTSRGKPPTMGVLAQWAGRLWIVNFLLDLAILYFAMPAMTGPYWGGQWLLWPLLITGVLALFGGSVLQMRSALESFTEQVNTGTFNGTMFSIHTGKSRGRSGRIGVVDSRTPTRPASRTSGSAGVLAIALVFIFAVILNGVIVASTTWFDPNAKALAAIPRIVNEPASSQLPPTDVNHIVLVARGVAAYLGQQVLAQNGQNLGSVYHTDLEEYTLQSVKGHLYWIAPLVYNNVWANLGHWESPGYVQVDAEDPNTPAKLQTNHPMHYLPDAIFNQDLLRHVYLSGYTNGNLVDPTLEVNDDGTPYFTISLMQPTRGFTGEVVARVLLVNPRTGAIMSYKPQDVPAWVDRIIPADTVTEYLTWWGKYINAPWFNPAGSNQQAPAVDQDDPPELIYNQLGANDYPVWLVPMTSSASTDNSSTGIVLYDTRDNTGHFYPLTGLGVTSNVKSTFKSNPRNIRDYDVANVQLYQIYGEPTWVATFVQVNDFGQSFQAVGMVDARHLNGANVIMEPSKTQALASYAQWLADHNVQSSTATPSGKTATLQGKVQRISAATENGTTVYYMTIDGQTRIFRAGLALSAKLPLVREGDTVAVSFLETGQNVVNLTAFDDLSISVSATNATPAP